MTNADRFLADSLQTVARTLFEGGALVSLEQLDELGWNELVGLHAEPAVTAMAEEQGRSHGRSRLIELEMARILGLDPHSVGIAFSLGGTACRSTIFDGILLADGAVPPIVLAPVRTVCGVGLASLGRTAVASESIRGIDASTGWWRVSGTVDPQDVEPLSAWPDAVAAGRRVLAHELVGLAAVMLEGAIEYTKTRNQFGVPIGSFQAVQHRLADAHVHLEAARAVARTAWLDDNPNTTTAALSASLRAIESATQHCHQVYGAFGCTWEYPLHHAIRRGIALSLLLDPSEDLIDLVQTHIVSSMRIEVLQ